LTNKGGIRSEFTITSSRPRYYLVSAGAAERYDSDFLFKACRAWQRQLRNITTSRGCSSSPDRGRAT
jgi:hypothetical protein